MEPYSSPEKKEIQDSLGFWIPRLEFEVLDSKSLSGELGFLISFVSGIPDSKYDIFTDLYPSSHSPELHQCICSRELHPQSHHLLEKPAAISEQVGASDRVTVVTDPAACARLSDKRGVSKMRVIGKNRESVFTSVLAISAHCFVSCSMEQAW